MDFLLWITIGFIVIGFVIFIYMKKAMENKLTFIKTNSENKKSTTEAKSVIWWIVGVTAWG